LINACSSLIDIVQQTNINKAKIIKIIMVLEDITKVYQDLSRLIKKNNDNHEEPSIKDNELFFIWQTGRLKGRVNVINGDGEISITLGGIMGDIISLGCRAGDLERASQIYRTIERYLAEHGQPLKKEDEYGKQIYRLVN
jgi:hypothetical protein